MSKFIKNLKNYAERSWYPPFIALLAGLDFFVIVIPTDGILISSSMIAPKRWWSLAIWVAIGSTLGALFLAGFVEAYGMDWILKLFPGIQDTKTWIWTFHFFKEYGLYLLFVISLSPLVLQPAVIISSLAGSPIPKLGVAIILGRLVKYIFLAYVGSHTPKLLTKLWGVKKELQEVGVIKPKL